MTLPVSILMTVYNGERFVKEAVQSLLSQSFGDFEFHIIDNASTDHTVDLIEGFQDSRIRLIRNETNQGQTKALNRGIGEAKGALLARMDADDVSHKDRLKKQVAYFQAHPTADVVGTWHHEIDENGRMLKTMRYPTDPLEIKCQLLSDGDLTKRCLAHPTVMVKTAVLKRAGGYDESILFAQDYELWTRLMIDHEIHNIGEPLFFYRASPSSTSHKNRAALTAELDRIVGASIKRLWPEIDKQSEEGLLQMLRNKPPAAGVSATELATAFDALFERLFKGQVITPKHTALRERIKLYYWPRLVAGKTASAAGFFWPGAKVAPGSFIDSKFHKNVAKSLLRR